MVTAVPPRSEISKEYTWNAESVFLTKADWDAACDHVLAMIPDVQSYQGRLAESPAVLADYFDLIDQMMRIVGRIYSYAGMSFAVNTQDQEAVAMNSRSNGVYARAGAAQAFSEPELIALGHDQLKQWMEQEPRLVYLAQYFDNLFRRQAHVRSAEVEEVLGLVSEPLDAVSETAGLLLNADLKFAPAVDSDGNEVPVSQGSLGTLLDSPDRELRRTAWENYADGHLAFKNTLANNLYVSVKTDVFRAKARNYPSSLEASLFENNIPTTVFYNLINTFQRNIPTWHKYWQVRRKALGYNELHPYDVWAPITSNEPEVSYHQAVDWICEGMKPLGDEYVNVMRRGCLEDRWVDVYPNQGKRSGAFSNGTHETFPFIMMSYKNDLGAMSTLAHELGHSMHSYYSRQTQPQVYSHYSLFVAEVASNFNQALTRAYLMNHNNDRDFQIALIQEAMGNFHRYFFVMPTLARFELEIHERAERGEGVTAQDMNNLMADLFAEGYGSEMQIDRERVGITWATFPHLYSAYYVYAYATGISAAHALADKILTGDANAAKRYVEFLSAGSSLYPLDALKHAGVDMESPQAVETTFAILANMVDRLEELTS